MIEYLNLQLNNGNIRACEKHMLFLNTKIKDRGENNYDKHKTLG